MERDPWWGRLPDDAPLPRWTGPVGVKPDGGGSVRGQGRVGRMLLHRAAHNRDAEAIVRLADAGEDVNEVEAAGNTPLHACAWQGWAQGARLLLQLGAKAGATNNAGEGAWHWAARMGHAEVAALLEENGASKEKGPVLVPEHVPKVKDFFSRACWAHHPLPYADYVAAQKADAAALEEERRKLPRVPAGAAAEGGGAGK